MASTNSNASVQARLRDVKQIMKTDGAPAAEKAIIEILKDEPKSDAAFIALARVLAKQGRTQDAERAAEKAKGLAPLDPMPLTMIGSLRLKAEDFEAAAAAFAEALAIDPNSERALLGAAMVKMRQEEFDDARAMVQKILDGDPENERANEMMARLCMQTEDQEGAEKILRQVIAANPNNMRASRGLVHLLKTQDRQDEAVELFQQSVDEDPDNPRRIARFAQVASQAGRPEAAASYVEAAADSKSVGTAGRLMMIGAMIQLGMTKSAEKRIDDLGKSRIASPVALKLRGDIALVSDKPDEAISLYKQSCAAAKLPALDAADLKDAKDDAAQAKLWRQHSRKQLANAARKLKEKRAGD